MNYHFPMRTLTATLIKLTIEVAFGARKRKKIQHNPLGFLSLTTECKTNITFNKAFWDGVAHKQVFSFLDCIYLLKS